MWPTVRDTVRHWWCVVVDVCVCCSKALQQQSHEAGRPRANWVNIRDDSAVFQVLHLKQLLSGSLHISTHTHLYSHTHIHKYKYIFLVSEYVCVRQSVSECLRVSQSILLCVNVLVVVL